jgi:hypothetical protein
VLDLDHFVAAKLAKAGANGLHASAILVATARKPDRFDFTDLVAAKLTELVAGHIGTRASNGMTSARRISKK